MVIIKCSGFAGSVNVTSTSLAASFFSVFFLTISSPMTIVFYTGLFSAKAIEYNYTKRELYIFGLAVSLATLLFMGTSVIVSSLLKETVPILLIKVLSLVVGAVLIGYGLAGLIKNIKET